MGATLTSQIATGKTAGEAFRRALDAASAEYGHQDGYSGAINSKDGSFSMVELPPRLTYRKYLSLLCDSEYAQDDEDFARDIAHFERTLAQNLCKRSDRPSVRKRIAETKKWQRQAATKRKNLDATLARFGISKRDFENDVRAFSDKWGPSLCVELTPTEAKALRPYGEKPRRGEKTYVFFGYAPC